jgi:ATP-dependent DNA helicase RecG
MNRLVQGDVGSGKTVLAAAALLKAAKSGWQGAMMAPTGILARQHYDSLNQLFQDSGIRLALVTGNTPQKQKKELLEQIRSGEIDIAVGTHALLEEKVIFNRLGLVVTDEQHRFGVRQRSMLAAKGGNPDVLVMTATPIPRTLALILYGDLDISVLDEMPPGRKPVETYVVNEGMRHRINNFIRKNVNEGHQVFVVCPLVEESEALEEKSAEALADQYRTEEFSDLKVGLLHGRMKASEKDQVMESFADGSINILVSTTVVEVGVNIPNANLMVIENAERFGLAQLHQLRGRVGRGGQRSYCVLYNNGAAEVSAERMKVMEKTSDGFVIAERDLELRGPGEFFGTRQHGLPELRIANLYSDIDILREAQTAAKELMIKDRGLEESENTKIRDYVEQIYTRNGQG